MKDKYISLSTSEGKKNFNLIIIPTDFDNLTALYFMWLSKTRFLYKNIPRNFIDRVRFIIQVPILNSGN